MGTRSLTYVYDSFKNDNGQKQNVPIVCLYRQYDGYPEGHGAELAQFLVNGNIVNGLGSDENESVWNGMGCLAASMVAHFKKHPGNFYLHAPILNRDDWQEFEYHVFDDKVIVYSVGSNQIKDIDLKFQDHLLFEGDYRAFAEYCKVNNESFDLNDRNQVEELLHNKEATITFTKVDGTKRVMRCTLNESLIPKTSQVKSSGKKLVSNEVLPVFDLDAQHWKSFRWDSLLNVEI